MPGPFEFALLFGIVAVPVTLWWIVSCARAHRRKLHLDVQIREADLEARKTFD